MTKTTIEQIRTVLVRAKAGAGRPYPDGARRAVLTLLEQRERKGVGLSHVAAEVGVSATTLRKWKRETPTMARTSAADFCEVEILAERRAASALVVHGPFGLRIEGATLEDIAELVRRLS